MTTELASQEKVIGVKQSRKAIREGRARRVFLACDADPAITDPVAESCAAAGIPTETDCTMSQLHLGQDGQDPQHHSRERKVLVAEECRRAEPLRCDRIPHAERQEGC